MTYPSVFYYQSKVNEPDYGTSQPGEISPIRLVKQRPYRKKPYRNEDKKKTLILSDWTALKWLPEKQKDAMTAIKKLMDDGFEIYIWQDPNVILLSENNLSILNDDSVRRNITFKPDDIIVDALIKKHPRLLKEEIYVLDDYWLNQVIDPNSPKQRSLNLSHIILYQNKINEICSILEKKTPPLEEILLEFSNTSNLALHTLNDKFIEKIFINDKYQSVSLEPSFLQSLHENHKVDLGRIQINYEQLAEIQELKIENISYHLEKIEAEILQDILVQMKKINRIELNRVEVIGDISNELLFEHLNIFSLTNTTISAKNLQHILSKSKLISLNLNYSTVSGDLTSEVDLEYLESLSLEGTTISAISLQGLIAKSKNLKSICISAVTSVNDISHDLPLESLEILKITKLTSVISLKHLISKSKVLKSIELRNAKLIQDFNHIFQLESLETLSLCFADILLINLQNLISKSKGLKELNLSSAKLSSDLNNQLSLESLEKLNLASTNISVISLQNLIAQSKNLKILNLSGVKLLGDINNQLPLESLELLNASSTNISVISLQNLIVQSKNLKILNLSEVKLLGDISIELPLKNLEELDLSNVDTSEKNLGLLLNGSLNLIKLDLSGVDLTHVNIDITFNRLEDLDLKDAKISASNLETLLNPGNTIKSLWLFRANISGEISQHLSLTSLESLTLPYNISSANLSCLLAGAVSLKSLYLADRVLHDEIRDQLQLKSLENLNLSKSTLSAKSLQSFLCQAINLKELNLSEIDLQGDINEDLPLTSLEKLTLVDSINGKKAKITAQSLQAILANATNIKSLDLSVLEFPGTINHDLKLTSLETLELNYNKNISSISLQSLLSHAKNLKILELNYCEFTGKISHDLPLESLEEIRLASAIISLDNLQYILVKAKNLKQLDLSKTKLDGNINTDLSLDSLENLDLANKIISAKSLEHLIANSKCLKTMMLGHIEGKLSAKFSSPIESLTLWGSQINTEELIDLLNKLPRLKKLEIFFCNKINFDDKKLIPLLQAKGYQAPYQSSYPSSYSSYSQSSAERQSFFNSVIDYSIPHPHEKNPPQIFPNSNVPQIPSERNFDEEKERPILENFQSTSSESTFPSIKDQSPAFRTPKRSTTPKVCDTNTIRDPNKKFNLRQIFLGKHKTPHPSKYRLAVHHRLVINPNVEAVYPFTLDNKDPQNIDLDLQLVKRKILKSEIDNLYKQYSESHDDNLYYGKMDLVLDGEWQALPSLYSNETLQQYHVENNVPCEIMYSVRDNLYYIRSKYHKTYNVKFDFLLSAQPINKKEFAQNKLNELIQFYKSFGEGEIKREPGQSFLDAINDKIKGKKGSCRHRSVALMDAINNKKGDHGLPETIQCRSVGNDCHEFVEIRLDENQPWIAYNLGGYSAELNIDQSNMPAAAEFSVPEDVDGFTTAALSKIPFSPENLEGFIKPTVSDILLSEKTSEDKPTNYNVDYFIKELETWVEEKPETNQGKFFLNLTNGRKKKQLVNLSSTTHVNAMGLALEKYCQNKSQPVYYIHSPDDLVCSSDFITKTGDRGDLTTGPGGQLYEFLKTNNKKNAVLIVNYDRFKADDIVRLNTLLDEVPKADGTDLPERAIVVGLINPNKIDCYKGEDFYSRFGIGNITTCTFTEEQLIKPLHKFSTADKETSEQNFKINLFHSINWEEKLLGHWVIKKDHLHFKKGLLIEALESGRTIQIENGLWKNEAFCHFWDRARTLGYIEIEGIRTLIPNKIKFLQSDGYDLQTLSQWMTLDSDIQTEREVLNPTRFNDFFYRYDCDNETHQLDTLVGLIEQHRGKDFHINLTQSLDEDQWAELLMECDKHQIKLHCHCAPFVTLPAAIGDVATLPPPKPSTAPPFVIESTDIDVTIHQITQSGTWTVIDVSELNPEHLLQNLDGKLIQKRDESDGIIRPAFEFTQTDSVLTKAFAEGENVILKGQFSPQLIDMLAPTLLKKQAGNLKQELVLVTANATQLKFVSTMPHSVTLEEKRQCLEKDFPSEEINKVVSKYANEPLSRLRALLTQSSPWEGLTGLSADINLNDFDEINSETLSNKFIEERQKAVKDVLDKSPYVFLTGLTGVGKSTFVEKHLINQGETLYEGESSIRDWAKDTKPGRKILFLDEANISPLQWSQFEGLFQIPPYIIITDKKTIKKIPLSKEHKVVFAGNPLNYGGNRKMASFFWRHGKAVVFKPMPLEFIYERILKPVFAKTELEPYTSTISKEILKIYQFLCNCSQDEILISPREVQMMALLVLSHYQDYPEDDIKKVTQHFAYLLAEPLVPSQDRNKFEAVFSDPLPKKPVANRPDNFVLTPSREPLYQYLNDLIAMREYRRANTVNPTDKNEKLNDAQLYGGLGGIVIEGDPGIGKSELVIAHLRAHQYEEVHLHDKTVPDKAFYRLPISMSIEKKTEMLVKAFHEGAVVIIDEINAAPMMEQLLNDLLMGKGPNGGYELQLMSEVDFAQVSDDQKNKPYLLKTEDGYKLWGYKKGKWQLTEMKKDFEIPPKWQDKESVFVSYLDEIYKTLNQGHRPGYGRPNKPGFFVIATQNPVTMSGRYKPSKASIHRITTFNLPAYPSEELKNILSEQQIANYYVEAMVSAYQINLEKAKRQKLSPVPTFRNLVNVAKNFVAKMGKAASVFVPNEPAVVNPVEISKEKTEQEIKYKKPIKVLPQLYDNENDSRLNEEENKSVPQGSRNKFISIMFKDLSLVIKSSFWNDKGLSKFSDEKFLPDGIKKCRQILNENIDEINKIEAIFMLSTLKAKEHQEREESYFSIFNMPISKEVREFYYELRDLSVMWHAFHFNEEQIKTSLNRLMLLSKITPKKDINTP